jgi:DNA-directed RNA polymerase beta' subunit
MKRSERKLRFLLNVFWLEILKKEIADYTAGNLLEEVIEDEIKTGKLSNSEIYYLQSIFENNGFKNVSKLIENKVKEKEEKEKVKKKGKI